MVYSNWPYFLCDIQTLTDKHPTLIYVMSQKLPPLKKRRKNEFLTFLTLKGVNEAREGFDSFFLKYSCMTIMTFRVVLHEKSVF